MRFFDPHIHMCSRTTDDYQAMADAGMRAIIEPAFWLGQPRTNIGSFVDYFASLVGWERFRASQFGIAHYCAIGLNSKEAQSLANTISDIHKSGMTVVLIEHNLGEVMRLCERLVVLDNGGKIGDGLPREVMTDPVVQAAYLGGDKLAANQSQSQAKETEHA